ncbi:hypothetical protein NDN08_000284 [Rhodosorus marinus]|uniref:Mediator of RNA polymerase II transcription subunit 12 n=1 Tax=Rhodosorus marinus TaxID=101924 RepID=A0AAV8UMS6_9RHOD|nr:hypothetical protein NDN08_000284 [Rhodosorus marinus]
MASHANNLRAFSVPRNVPLDDKKDPADLYIVHDSPADDPEKISEELVLNDTTVISGHAEWRKVWEFDSCIKNGSSVNTSNSGGHSNLAVNVNSGGVARIASTVSELSKRRPRGLRFVLKERDDTTFSEQLAFPLQKPSVNIAFEEFLLRLARGPCKAVSKDVPLGPAISRSVGKTLEMMMEKNIPPQAAVWFLKVAILNELPKKTRPDKPPPFAKWLWFKLASEHFRAQLESYRALSVSPQTSASKSNQWEYFLSILRFQADEGLLDELTLVGRLLFVELRKELQTDYGEDERPSCALVFQKQLLDMLLGAMQEFEPEILASRESTVALNQLLKTAMSPTSARFIPFRKRLLQVSRTTNKRLLEADCLTNSQLLLGDDQNPGTPRSRGRNRGMVYDRDAFHKKMLLLGCLTKMAWTGNFSEAVELCQSAFNTTTAAVRFLVKWTLCGTTSTCPLAGLTAGSVIRLLEKAKRTRRQRAQGRFMFQRPITSEVEVCLSKGLAECDAAVEFLLHLSSVECISISNYLKYIRAGLAKAPKLHGIGEDLVRRFPETMDRNATLRRQILKSLGVDNMEATVTYDPSVIERVLSNDLVSARAAGKELRKRHGLSSRLTHCDIAVKCGEDVRVSVLVSFLLEAGAYRTASSFLVDMLKHVEERGDAIDKADIISSLSGMGLLFSARGDLDLVMDLAMNWSKSEPQAVQRLLGALAISFKDTSSAVLEQYLDAGIDISSAIQELGDSRRTLEEFIIPLAKVFQPPYRSTHVPEEILKLFIRNQRNPSRQLSAVDVVKNANIFNGNLFAMWLQLELQRTSLTTSEVDALAAEIMALLVEDKSIEPLIYDVLIKPESLRLRERFLSILLTKFSSGFEGLMVSSSETLNRSTERLAEVDYICFKLLKYLSFHSEVHVDFELVQEDMIKQLKQIKETLGNVLPEKLMHHKYVGKAVLRRIELLRGAGFDGLVANSTELLLQTLEVVVPALEESEVEDILSAIQGSENLTTEGKERDETGLKRRVVTSNVHFWLSARQRLILCSSFAVARGMNGAYRRSIVAFAPSEEAPAKRRLLDNWNLLEGQGLDATMSTPTFGIQIKGDSKPVRFLKRYSSSYASLSK